jgi:hypothetical protein
MIFREDIPEKELLRIKAFYPRQFMAGKGVPFPLSHPSIRRRALFYAGNCPFHRI